jgi:adenylate cyclase
MPRILIVDDEQENRSALKRALSDENPTWEILTADEDQSATALIRSQLLKHEPIDVVLTDLVMTDEQSGMTLLREARQLDPQIMSILFTAKEKSLDRYQALDLGAFDVVEKNIRGAAAGREINIKTRAAIRYREWSQRIGFLRRYFDPRVFDMIEKDPSILALRQRMVTIVFWDIRGFSTLCEVLKEHPTLIAGFLRDYSEAGAQSVFRYGGLLDKFIGDGIMALFGVLNHKEDDGRADAFAAVRAAIDLRSAFDDLLKQWMPQWNLYTAQKIEISLGCGIHTGEALVGNLGTEFRDQFTALGPHVNLASRIEGRSRDAQILISQTTHLRVQEHVVDGRVFEVNDIKNIPGTYSVFAVEGVRGEPKLPSV